MQKYIEFEQFVSAVEKAGGTVSGKPIRWMKVEYKCVGVASSYIFSNKSKVDSLAIVDYGGENLISVGDDSKLCGLIKIGRKSRLTIGQQLSCTSGIKFHISEGTSVVIGDGCMVGNAVSIYSHDYHPVFSLEDGQRLNKSKDVVLGDHVWLANEVTVLKGAVIGRGSIIGIRSLVSSEIPEHCVALGQPARVVKEKVFWKRFSFNTTHLDGIEGCIYDDTVQ